MGRAIEHLIFGYWNEILFFFFNRTINDYEVDYCVYVFGHYIEWLGNLKPYHNFLRVEDDICIFFFFFIPGFFRIYVVLTQYFISYWIRCIVFGPKMVSFSSTCLMHDEIVCIWCAISLNLVSRLHLFISFQWFKLKITTDIKRQQYEWKKKNNTYVHIPKISETTKHRLFTHCI